MRYIVLEPEIAVKTDTDAQIQNFVHITPHTSICSDIAYIITVLFSSNRCTFTLSTVFSHNSGYGDL